MAEDGDAQGSGLPLVLLLRVFPHIPSYNYIFSSKYRAIKPLESSLPLHDFLNAHAQTVRALICSARTVLPAATLRCLPSLELIITTSSGHDHIDLDECRCRGIRIANAGDVFSEDVADFGVGLLLAVLRRVSAADRFVRQGIWSRTDYPLSWTLSGKRVGIVGFGSVGSRIAKRLDAFGCVISYTARKKKEFVSFPFHSDVLDLAADNDVLMLCCPLNDETRHIINRNMLLALGKGGVVVKIGRGALVCEKEMVQCLLQGEIAGAAFDVFEDEPNVPKELIQLDNVVLTPHNAMLTLESLSAMDEHVMANLDAFFSGKPLVSPVRY